MSNANIDLTAAIGENEMVFVRNVGDKPYVQDFANKRLRIEPGGELLVQYYAACLWFGDPRSINVGDPNNRETQYRTKEVDRLSVQYGLQDQPFYSDDISAVGTDTGLPYIERRHPNLPWCEVYMLDGTTRLITVIDDPEGTHLSERATDVTEKANMMDAFAQMQKNQERIMKMISERDPELAAELARANPSAASTAPAEDTALEELSSLDDDPEIDETREVGEDTGAGAQAPRKSAPRKTKQTA